MCCNRTTRLPTPMTTWKPNTKHMKRDIWQVNVHVVFLSVRVVVILTHWTPHRVAQVVRVFALISSMHEMSVTLRLRALHSIQFPTLPNLLQSPAAPAAFQLPRYVVTLCTPPTRRRGLQTNPTPTQRIGSWRCFRSWCNLEEKMGCLDPTWNALALLTLI